MANRVKIPAADFALFYRISTLCCKNSAGAFRPKPSAPIEEAAFWVKL
jgi:hypothetical protein